MMTLRMPGTNHFMTDGRYDLTRTIPHNDDGLGVNEGKEMYIGVPLDGGSHLYI